MIGRREETLRFVLANQLRNGSADFANVSGRRRPSVDAHARTSGFGYLANDAGFFPGIQPEAIGLESRPQRIVRLE